MAITKITTIDFETLPIQKRPDYPPKPVGVAVTEQSGKSYYLAWGHPCNNNTTMAKAKRILKGIYNDSIVICHHAKFDLEVAEKFMGLPLVPKHGYHCTMILAFLYNPRTWSLKLKDLAKDILGIEPEEQTKLKQWIFDNVPGVKKSKTKWGQYIYLAPGDLVGQYAKADTRMTKGLFKKFIPFIKSEKMLEQYEIEKRVSIESIYMERTGIMIDAKVLKPELVKAKKKLRCAENAIQKVLGNINLNSGAQKIEAFERLGLVKQWEYGKPTKTGQVNPKTSIESLMTVCTDKKLVGNLEIFSKYSKLINTYMVKWLDSANNNNGLYYPWINTLKGDDDKGTYTGRYSSDFQQVPRQPNNVFKGMPFLRSFILPDKKNNILINRDFMGQEVRILAHFTDGSLLVAFNKNPMLDGHDFVKSAMNDTTSIDYERDDVKACNFLIIYGGGAKALSKNIKISYQEAMNLLNVHNEALPEVSDLKNELNLMSRRGEQFYTAGGRVYNFDTDKVYIALNTLIQGSAADHTKRAFLNVADMIRKKGYDSRIMLPIHDELMISSQSKTKVPFMKDFKTYMEKDKLFDLPMLTDGKVGKNWGSMIKYKDK